MMINDDAQVTTSPQKLKGLERRLRRLQIFAGAMALCLTAVFCVAIMGRVYAAPPTRSGASAKNANFDTITVKRINVVENDGTRRLVIAGASSMPPPIVNGKTFKRAISPAGIIFYDQKGNERGGLTLAPRNGGEQSALVFDYARGEAIAMVRAQHDNYANAEFLINSPPAASAGFGTGKERIKVQTVNGKAQIVLNDAQGRPRLRFVVPKSGTPAIEFLNPNGNVIGKFTGTTMRRGADGGD